MSRSSGPGWRGVDVVGAVGVLGDAKRVVDPGLGRPWSRTAAPQRGCRRRKLPVTFSAASGVYFATVSRTASKPSQCSRMNSSSVRPSAQMTCAIALRSHTSVPGFSCRCVSYAIVVIQTARGSATISVAPLVHGALHLHRDDRVRLARVASDDEEEVRVADLPDGVRHRSRAEHGDQTGHRGGVSCRRALVHVVRAEHRARELLDEVVLLHRAARRADEAHGVGTVGRAYAHQARRRRA